MQTNQNTEGEIASTAPVQPPETTRMEIDYSKKDVSELLQRNCELESQLDSHQLSLARLQLRYEELRTKESAWAAQLKLQSAGLERAISQVNRLTGDTNSPGLNASSALQTEPLPFPSTTPQSSNEELTKLRLELNKVRKLLALKTEDFNYASTQNREALAGLAEVTSKYDNLQMKLRDALTSGSASLSESILQTLESS